MFVLDTNVVSELRPGKAQQSQKVLEWAGQHNINKFHIAAITLFELELGIQRLEARSPPQGQGMRRWLEVFTEQYATRVLSFSLHTAPLCASLHIPNPKSDRDGMIAASALEHGFTVVTRNVQDFKGTGVRLINPWQ